MPAYSDSDSDYDYLIEAIQAGDIDKLNEAEQIVEGFPDGCDNFVERHWLTNIIDLGTYSVLEWVLPKIKEINYRDEEGYTPLHSAIYRTEDRYRFVKKLIDHGADVNIRGTNDWTPLHLAAFRDDIEMLQLLLENGADPTLRTRIDNYATPLEEAKILGRSNAVEFLSKFVHK